MVMPDGPWWGSETNVSPGISPVGPPPGAKLEPPVLLSGGLSEKLV